MMGHRGKEGEERKSQDWKLTGFRIGDGESSEFGGVHLQTLWLSQFIAPDRNAQTHTHALEMIDTCSVSQNSALPTCLWHHHQEMLMGRLAVWLDLNGPTRAQHFVSSWKKISSSPLPSRFFIPTHIKSNNFFLFWASWWWWKNHWRGLKKRGEKEKPQRFIHLDPQSQVDDDDIFVRVSCQNIFNGLNLWGWFGFRHYFSIRHPVRVCLWRRENRRPPGSGLNGKAEAESCNHHHCTGWGSVVLWCNALFIAIFFWIMCATREALVNVQKAHRSTINERESKSQVLGNPYPLKSMRHVSWPRRPRWLSRCQVE